jgi:hypothetical protein
MVGSEVVVVVAVVESEMDWEDMVGRRKRKRRERSYVLRS